MALLSRRGVLGALLGAPAVITIPGLLMPIKWQPDWENWAMCIPRYQRERQNVYISNATTSIGCLQNSGAVPMVLHFEHGRVVRLQPGESLWNYACPTPRAPTRGEISMGTATICVRPRT